jgi:eukaryotic-like serine/threonine-protein kinase
MNMEIPNFRALDKRIDDRLNEILQRTLARDVNQRYPNADDLLYDLEHYIYHSGYGPTNETLGKLMRELFGQTANLATFGSKGSTRLLEHTARTKRRAKAA